MCCIDAREKDRVASPPSREEPCPAIPTANFSNAFRLTRKPSQIEEDGFPVALQANIEAVGHDIALLTPYNQRDATIRRHQRQDRIGSVRSSVLEIDPRDDLLRHAAREHRKENMRRLMKPRPPMVRQSVLTLFP